ncbi:hypothetical protein HaLaN_12221 [Haematococcus lacustris]|uniref:Uncharacterized protein n=1 Tax=Haematococcus lacustris TaxID=44745 RepID=A0A699Z9V0_HAELA|nr:hypothetical protein HaLaN_12221 [Haematococcus lacustris]
MTLYIRRSWLPYPGLIGRAALAAEWGHTFLAVRLHGPHGMTGHAFTPHQVDALPGLRDLHAQVQTSHSGVSENGGEVRATGKAIRNVPASNGIWVRNGVVTVI